MSSQYQCCGVHSYEDWRSLNTHWKKEAKEDEVAPRSCCETQFSNNTNCNTIVSELNHEVSSDMLGVIVWEMRVTPVIIGYRAVWGLCWTD